MAQLTERFTGRLRSVVPLILAYAGSGGALMASALAQLITFAILARALGVEQFGLYAAIIAVVTIGVQVNGVGSHESLVRRVAQDRAMFPAMLGHALILSAGSAIVLTGLGLVVLMVAFPVSVDMGEAVSASLMILLSHFVFLRIIVLSTQSFIAHSRFAEANAIEIAFAVARTLAAVLGCLVFGAGTVAEWALWQMGAHLVVAGAAAAMVLFRLGGPVPTLVFDEIRLGFLFATQFFFKAVRGNADLLVLSAVAGAEIVSSYALARRMLESSYMAVEALNRLIYPGSAALAVAGIHAVMGRTEKVMGAAFAIALASAGFIFLVAPLLPLIFGAEYVSLPGFTRILCWIVLPMAVYAVALEALGAAGLQGARAAIWNTGNVVGAGLVALATWAFAVQGTFVGYYAVEIAIAVVSWLVLLAYARRHAARGGHQPDAVAIRAR